MKNKSNNFPFWLTNFFASILAVGALFSYMLYLVLTIALNAEYERDVDKEEIKKIEFRERFSNGDDQN